MKVVTAELMGDPQAQFRRAPTPDEQRTRDARHTVFEGGSRGPLGKKTGIEHEGPRKRARNMPLGAIYDGFTKAQSIHYCTHLRQLGMKGKRRMNDGGSTYSVERVK